jgi:hypothetical protein
MNDRNDRFLIDRFAAHDAAATKPDFDDVRLRAAGKLDSSAARADESALGRKSLLTARNVRLGVAAALVVGAGLAGFMLFGASSSSGSAGLDTISNRGTVTASIRAPGFDVQHAFLLGRRNGHDFYRLSTSSSGTCYAIGDAQAAGFVACPHSAFPTASQPAMVSVVAGSNRRGAPRASLQASVVEGITADGITSIEIRNAKSQKVGGGPVSGNVFSLPVSAQASGLTVIARNASGDVAWSQSY